MRGCEVIGQNVAGFPAQRPVDLNNTRVPDPIVPRREPRHSWGHASPSHPGTVTGSVHRGRSQYGAAGGGGCRSEGEPSGDEPASRRHLLPRDLPGALKHLNDSELDALHKATLDELKRRDRLPSTVMKQSTPAHLTPHPRQTPSDREVSLTRGQLNAVRAAFKAGVKPAAIARQFGISQSDIRKALAAEVRDRKTSALTDTCSGAKLVRLLVSAGAQRPSIAGRLRPDSRALVTRKPDGVCDVANLLSDRRARGAPISLRLL